MKIHTIQFVSSSIHYQQCPQDHKPEIAFMGRSNVGKSSLINALLNRKQLAKVSKTAGKTGCINHYLVNNQFHLVDLPGYGWAAVSHTTQTKWKKMIAAYLLHRTQLLSTFLLIDAKLTPQPIDLTCMRWLGLNHIPFSIILTKSDKKNKSIVHKNHQIFLHTLAQEWATLPPIFFVSAHDQLGLDNVRTYMQAITS
ncbi:ribosome biogenesis GTP-binding protein YihA/YsxC [Candidatus Cardinium hertigii]|uniref:Probable GTP-binding protein EngB n=1 Tax=Candidatus Cardinium hertigii TaxID=247481 RepID=A0A2Z3L9I3_9BACT|nr:ribosome biogenesis GTP-binding protein YihA/YsxC [Candidatus Cardinium hertigii]AWN82031.1 putative GTP-binding protein EngB [Candidatus Cardinium hertigii]